MLAINGRAHARLVRKAGNCQWSDHLDHDKGHRLPVEGTLPSQCPKGCMPGSEAWRAIASGVVIRTAIKGGGAGHPSKQMHAQASEAWRAIPVEWSSGPQ